MSSTGVGSKLKKLGEKALDLCCNIAGCVDGSICERSGRDKAMPRY